MTLDEVVEKLAKHGGRLLIYEFPTGEGQAVLDDAEGVDQAGPSQTPAELAASQDQPLKLSQWAKLTGVTSRELRRAISHSALCSHRKEDGRDAGAIMVHPEDMADYLRLCKAVQGGHEPPPEWWSKVRLGAAGRVNRAA